MAHEHGGVGHGRVLIVEDIPRLREMLSRAIRDMEFIPVAVGSGEEGIAALERESTDIALVDLALPGMSGLEFCELAHQRWSGMKVVILTGYGDLEAARKAIRLEVVDFLIKPCALGELEVALGRAMRSRHQESRPLAPEESGAEVERDDREEEGTDARTIEDAERELILDALARHDGNRARTAEELGISLRTLYYRLSMYEARGQFHRE